MKYKHKMPSGSNRDKHKHTKRFIKSENDPFFKIAIYYRKSRFGKRKRKRK